MSIPRLRPVEAFPVEQDGQVLVALRDPDRIAQKLVLLPPLEFAIVAHLDGKNDAAAVVAKVAREKGLKGVLTAARVERVVKVLDDNLFLDSPRFAAHMKDVLREYRSAPVREPAHAGAVYPEERSALALDLDKYYRAPKGPGLPGKSPKKSKGDLVGLVAPHIDFPRGGPAYAWAYREVLTSGLADLYVILGVAHVSPPTPFVGTRKDYGTPFGPAATDRALVEDLAKAAPYDLFSDELVHRTEHSIEFQTVFLNHVRESAGGAFRALPLLCSCRGQDMAAPVLERLARLLKGYDGRVCLLAGVDLAHVGPRFGDKDPVTPELLRWVETEDRKSLNYVAGLDAAGFYEHINSDGDRRKVCGTYALKAFTWLLKELHPKAKGDLLCYDHAEDPAGGEVSFASMAFHL